MKKVSLGIAAVAALIGTPALAADIALKAPCCATPVYNWTGFYGGLNAGASWGQAGNTFNFVPTGVAPAFIASDSSHPAGFIGGGQLGYNWQVNTVVLGLETDVQGSTQRASATAPGLATTCAGCSVSETDKLTWFGTTRGRIGLASDGWLPYVTGGVAYAGVQSNGTQPVPGISVVPTLGGSTVRTGWTVGGGLEAALSGRWTWKVEYLYMNLGTANFTTSSPTPPFAPGSFTQSMSVTDSIVRGGVNLRY